MRFIRKNGRVIPIRESNEIDVSMTLQKKPISAGKRFKRGAVGGGVLGFLLSAPAGHFGAEAAMANIKAMGHGVRDVTPMTKLMRAGRVITHSPNAMALVGVGAMTALGALAGGGIHSLIGSRHDTILKLKKKKNG